MLSQERQSAKSPTSSVQSGSTRTGPVTNAVRAQSAASSISEKSEKSTVSSDSRPSQPVQKKPVQSSGSESDSGSERRAPPAKNLGRQDSSGSESDSKPSNSRVPAPPSLANKFALGVAKTAAQTLARRIMPSGRDSDKSERSDDSTTKKKPDTKYPTITKLATSNPLSTIPSSVAQRLTNGKTKGQSVFEQVDLHTGKASYLGSGNYRNLEECIRDCLSKDQDHRNWSHSSLHHHRSSWKNLTRASVLEDYSYDGVISSNSRHRYHHYLHDDDHHHHHSSYSLSRHHRHKSPADLTLEEIRHINDELAKYGIPVFSAHHHSSSQYQRPQTIGEILSACQMLSNNPTLNQQNQYNNHPGAVQHVWDQIHYYQPTMNPPAPPPPAFNSPSSGGGALAKLFGGPSAPPPAPFYPGGYPPAPPPPAAAGGGGGGVLSKLFGQPAAAPPPPMQYNTGPSMMPPPSYPPPGPPPPAGGGSGQSVLASLFGGGR